MQVKGTAYHARLMLLRSKWGDARVDAFLQKFRREHPRFPSTVLPTTWLPAADFLALIDAIVVDVYAGDTGSLWEIGEMSAAFTLREGPYRNLLETRDAVKFAGLGKAMWANFFDAGEAHSELHGSCVDVHVTGVPEAHRHLYFEFSVMGYFRRGLELLDQKARTECVLGFSKGDARIHYKFHLLNAPPK
jgi:hypothetical protein